MKLFANMRRARIARRLRVPLVAAVIVGTTVSTGWTYHLDREVESQALARRGATADEAKDAAAAADLERLALWQKVVDTGRVRVIAQLTGVDEDPPASESDDVARTQTIVRLGNELTSAIAGTGTIVVHQFERVPFLALETNASGLDALERSGRLVSIIEDALTAPTLTESTRLVEADQAWAGGTEGTGHAVAVLDTGVDGSHPFLAGKVVAEACFSSLAGCPNGGTQQLGPGSGQPCRYARECAHGTHVAGIAAGRGADTSGVARGAGIVAIQVFSPIWNASECSGGQVPCARAYTSDWVAALDFVLANRARLKIAAVNMSLGGDNFGSQTACDGNAAQTGAKAAIDRLRAAGVATVASAGNSFERTYTQGVGSPACISSAVSVGATDKSDVVAGYSQRAAFLSLLAPGSEIVSSVPGGQYASFSGTSMAAPHVAGAWALAKERRPEASVDQVLAALRTTGTGIRESHFGLVTPRIRIRHALDTLGGGGGDACPCRSDVDNLCSYPANTTGCSMTMPGGYCDPNGDGNMADGDWVRGWVDYQSQCTHDPGHPGPCGCREGYDNVCSYPDARACGFTFCDPNGDGSAVDGDWVRGWVEYRSQCAGTPDPGPGDCGCRADVDNFCSYADPRSCGWHYCDPNGDGSGADGDWVRGWSEYRAECVAPPRVCEPGMVRGCYDGAPATRGVGTCRDGFETCAADGQWSGDCAGQVTPTSEVCGTGLDEDCDGAVDESCEVPCGLQIENRFDGPLNFALGADDYTPSPFTIPGRTTWHWDPAGIASYHVRYDRSFAPGGQWQEYRLSPGRRYTFGPTDVPGDIGLFDSGGCR